MPEGTSPVRTEGTRRLLRLSAVLLAIEFLDEFVFGAREAAWPLIRDDLGLSYAQIGLLLGVPAVLGNLLELPLGILGDVWARRALVVGGGVVFALALLMWALAPSFIVLLVGTTLFFPASGAFVSLSQATLMDLEPTRHEQAMARWTLAGSLGVVAGPLALGAALWLGGGWRELFVAFALLAMGLALVAWRQPFPARSETAATSLRAGIAGAAGALQRGPVRRWLVLLFFSDFMLDVLLGFLALYFVDVVGTSEGTAARAIAVWTGVGLVGDALLIPLLERVRGLAYLRVSATLMLGLFPAFLLVPGLPAKLLLLALLGLLNAGWYAILKGQLYQTLPGQSGTAMALGSFQGMVAGIAPLLLGAVAQQVGLATMMWALLLGPVVVLAGVWRTAEG